MLERVWRKGNPLALLVGMQNGAATLEDSLVISYKMKQILGIYPNELKNMSTQKNCSSVYNSQDMEAT